MIRNLYAALVVYYFVLLWPLMYLAVYNWFYPLDLQLLRLIVLSILLFYNIPTIIYNKKLWGYLYTPISKSI